jgi:hypothetical protein
MVSSASKKRKENKVREILGNIFCSAKSAEVDIWGIKEENEIND